MAHKDPEKYKEYLKHYRETHKNEIREYNKKYREQKTEQDPEYYKKHEQKYYQQNKEKLNEANKKYRERTKEQRQQYSKEYRETHRELKNELNSKHLKQTNAKTKLTAHNHYATWEPDEIEILKHMVKQGCTYNEIAIHLGRTHHSIASKLTKMRKNGDPFNGNPVDI